jgi:flagellar hook-associated protein 3 FlgL
MIENVATIVAARRSQYDIMRLQSRLSTLNREVATGSKADISGELGSRTPLLIGLRDAHARTERYLQSNATLTMRLDAMQVALGAMQDAAGQLGWEALAALGRSDHTSLRNVQISAAATLETVVRHLNTSVSGRFLFSGTLVESTPMVTGAAPAGVVGSVVADAATAAGGQIDVGDVAGLIADLDAVFDDTHANPAFRFSSAFYEGAPASEADLAGQLDENTRITYGLKANDQAFRDLMQGLHMLSAVRSGDAVMTEAAYIQFAEAGVAKLQQGLGRMIDLAARTGQNQARAADNLERLETARDLYNREIVELERRDPYEAATLIKALEQQLEASYMVTARLSQLSLVEFLR